MQSTIAASPGGALLQCAVSVNRMCEHMADVFEVSAREVFAVAELVIHGPCSASELADRLYITRGAMTAMIRRLEQGGWITTSDDPRDGRRLIVSATDRPIGLFDWWANAFSTRFCEAIADGPTTPTTVVADIAHVLEQYRAFLMTMGPRELHDLRAAN